MPWANIIRIGWGLGFLVAAAFNLIYTLQADLDPFWEWFRENAWFTVYKDMLERIVIPNGSVIVVLTVVFEVVTGVLILNKLLWARLGLVLALLWPIFLLPLMPKGPEMTTVILLAIGPALLLLGEYETTFWELLRARF